MLPEDKRTAVREGLVRFKTAWLEDWAQREEAAKVLSDVIGEVAKAYCRVTRGGQRAATVGTLLAESAQQLANLGPLRTGELMNAVACLTLSRTSSKMIFSQPF